MKCPRCGNKLSGQTVNSYTVLKSHNRYNIVENICPGCGYSEHVGRIKDDSED